MATLRVSASAWSRRALTVVRPQIQLAYRARISARPLLRLKGAGYPYSTAAAAERPTLAPKIDRSASKLFKNADEAVADVQSGSTILSSGFGLCGVAGNRGSCAITRCILAGELTLALTRNTDLSHASPRSRESPFLDCSIQQCRCPWERWAFYPNTSGPSQSIGSIISRKQ